MLKRYIIILITTILIVLFAIQNVEKVDIKFLMFDVSASLSLLMIITLALGALVTLLLSYQEIRLRNQKIKKLEKKLRDSDQAFSTPEYVTGEEKDQKI